MVRMLIGLSHSVKIDKTFFSDTYINYPPKMIFTNIFYLLFNNPALYFNKKRAILLLKETQNNTNHSIFSFLKCINKITIDIVKTIALKFILPLPIRLYKNAIIPYIKRKPVNLLSFLLFIFKKSPHSAYLS